MNKTEIPSPIPVLLFLLQTALGVLLLMLSLAVMMLFTLVTAAVMTKLAATQLWERAARTTATTWTFMTTLKTLLKRRSTS